MSVGFSGFYLNRRSSVCPRAWLGWTWLCQPECFTLVGLLEMLGNVLCSFLGNSVGIRSVCKQLDVKRVTDAAVCMCA